MDSILTNLSAGNYPIAILDANGCALQTNFQIQQADSISIMSEIVDASTANSEDGTIAILNTIGGTAPFSYAWNTGQTTATISNLLAGIYEVTIIDNNSCEQIFSFEVDFISNINASTQKNDLELV